MSGWSNETLMKLVLASDEEETYQMLVRYREEVGKLACIRRMLGLFERSESGELCKKTWDTVFTVCLTDDEPEMDKESSQLWTDAFLSGLKHQEPEIRKASAEALSLRSNQQDLEVRVIQVLMDGLADENEDVRFACGWALQLARSSAIPHLIKALSDTKYQRPHQNREDRRSSVWDILFTIDRILSHSEIDPKHRHDCARAAASFLEERSPDDRVDYLDVWKAADTLGEHIGGREALRELLTLAEHPDPRVRASVAHGLGHLRSREAQQKLQVMLNDPTEIVRIEAAKYSEGHHVV